MHACSPWPQVRCFDPRGTVYFFVQQNINCCSLPTQCPWIMWVLHHWPCFSLEGPAWCLAGLDVGLCHVLSLGMSNPTGAATPCRRCCLQLILGGQILMRAFSWHDTPTDAHPHVFPALRPFLIERLIRAPVVIYAYQKYGTPMFELEKLTTLNIILDVGLQQKIICI